jgi:hypothetical protein
MRNRISSPTSIRRDRIRARAIGRGVSFLPAISGEKPVPDGDIPKIDSSKPLLRESVSLIHHEKTR